MAETVSRKRRVYTEIGKKIARLAKNQAQLAGVLKLTQQSVSGKLSGKIAVTLRDLECLADHYQVPLCYFVTPEAVTPEISRRLADILDSAPELQEAIEIASGLPPAFKRELPAILAALKSMVASGNGSGNQMGAGEADRAESQGAKRLT